MSPEDRREFEELKKTVRNLKMVQDVDFIESIKRRLRVNEDVESMVDTKIAAIELNDLADVNTTGVSNGQVIKYNSSNSTWEDANDNTA